MWSRVEGSARELAFFRVPTRTGASAERVGRLVPGMGGELTWLPGERVLHVWGCGSGCRGVRVYALDGKTLFDGTASMHQTSKDGSVVTADAEGVVRVFDGRSGHSFVSPGDARAIAPLDVHFRASRTVVARYVTQEERQEIELICSLEMGAASCTSTQGTCDHMSCRVERNIPTEKTPSRRL